MRIVSSALACLCALAPTMVLADTVSSFGLRTAPGQLARPALPFIRPASPNVSFSTYSGKLVVNLSVSVQSAIKTSDVIECEADVEVIDGSSGHSIVDFATVAATRSGSTATCSVPVPYSWSLASASQDMVGLSYQISNVASNSTPDLPMRLSQQTISNFAIPKSGATTTFSVKATI